MITIEQAGLNDIGIIKQLAYQIWPEAYKTMLSVDQLKYMLEWMYSEDALAMQMQEGHLFFLANCDSSPCGFASVSAKSGYTGIHKLNKLYVLPELHGKGIGYLLLNTVINIAREAGSGSLELNVNRHNPSIAFYLRNNFTIIDELDVDIGSGYFMNDYIMSLPL